MVDREDSVHVKIKLDVDEQDKAFTDNLAANMARNDEQRAVRGLDSDDDSIEIRKLREEIKKLEIQLKKGSKDPEIIKQKLQDKKDTLLLQQFKVGPVGQLNDFSKEQFTSLKRIIANPIQFMLAAFGKKVGKAAAVGGRAGPIGILIAFFTIIAKDLFYILFNEATAPGRPLDRRFKRIARLETMNFYDRQLQEELRHGYVEIRVTTTPGLRGGQSQVNGNLFEFSSGATGILQSSPYRNSQDIYRSQNATGISTDQNGSPRRRTQSGRFG